ncbi:MAG: site-2 protease family protein, partial [Candidatus Micrarchaeota archaeon]
VFRKHPKKFFGHALIVCTFFGTLLYSNSTAQSGWGMAAIGMLGGLLFFGIASLVIQALNIITVPESTAGAALIVPGVTIPFWEGLIAIIIAVTVHEIAHGVLAMIEKLEVKNSGVILFGVLPVGAFVEPNEKKLSGLEMHKKRRILIAGTTANFLTFLLFSVLIIPLVPLGMGMADGVQVAALSKDSASLGILAEKDIITAVNGQSATNYPQFAELMKGKKEGDVVKLTTDKGEKSIILGANGKMGIVPENHFPENIFAIGAFLFILGTMSWVIIINLALAVINLVPIFLTDGYRLVYEEARGVFPSKGDTNAKRIAIAAGAICVLLLLINFLPNFW